jgi:hypothetical protein
VQIARLDPGFASPEEAVDVLKDIILPGFDAFIQLKKERKSFSVFCRL